jgi:predicted phosphoribosyltransferase
MRAAILALRRFRPARIVVAMPAAPESTCKELDAEADEVVCATTPSPFFAVGQAYWNFMQTTDEEVRELLRTVRAPRHTDRHAARAAGVPVIRLAIRPAG